MRNHHAKTWGTALAVLGLAFWTAGWAPAERGIAGARQADDARTKREEPTRPSELEKLARELRSRIEALVERDGDLFEDPWLRYVKLHFGRAEQAVRSLVVDGEPNGAAINDFHYGLSAFARALDELPKWEPGTTGWGDVKGRKKPDSKRLGALAKAVREIQAKADRQSALQATERIQLDASTTPAEAAEYGARVMTTIERTLYEGLMSQVTGDGRTKTTEVVQEPLERLRRALAGLALEDSPAASPAELAAAFGAALREAKDSVAELREACGRLSRYLPWAGERVKLVESLLVGLSKNLGRLQPPKAG